jgi:hypothetical protein
MGFIRHHALIVTSWNADAIVLAHTEALRICQNERTWDQLAPVHTIPLSGITPPGINGYRSFCLYPDGSKEGWPESDIGDRVRAKLIAFMLTQRHEDGSGPLDWVEVSFGHEEPSRVANSSFEQVDCREPKMEKE